MPKIKVIELSAAERAALEGGHEQGSSSAFRRRCQMILLKSQGRMILLKSQGRTWSQVAELVGVCEMSIHNWVDRYEQEGIDGLRSAHQTESRW